MPLKSSIKFRNSGNKEILLFQSKGGGWYKVIRMSKRYLRGHFFLSTVLKHFMHKHEDRWYFCLEKLPLISDIGLIFSEEQLISVNDRADVRVSFPPTSCPAQQCCCNQEIKCAYSCVKCRPEPCLTLEPGCSLFLISSECSTTEMDSITPHFLYCTRRKH